MSLLTSSLENSRASRIAWLLQELNLNYEIKVYPKTLNGVGSEELLEVFPTGVSPVLTIIREGREPKTIGESGHIVSYLIENFDPSGKFKPVTEDDKELMDFYLHFSEASLQSHLISMFVGSVARKQVPWPISIITDQLLLKMNSAYYAKKLNINFKYLDSQLEKKGGGYFVGDHLTGADFMLDFPINACLFVGLDLSREIASGDVKEEFPNLYEWHQMILKEPARLEAEKKAKSKL